MEVTIQRNDITIFFKDPKVLVESGKDNTLITDFAKKQCWSILSKKVSNTF